MVHAQDSLLKFLEAGLAGKGVPLKADPQGLLTPNTVNVFFMLNTPLLRTWPSFSALDVSVDVLADSDATQTSRRKAALMMRAVDEVLVDFAVPKKDWSNPAAPAALGSFMWPEAWGGWRRVSDPDERFEHWNRTLTVRYFEEAR